MSLLQNSRQRLYSLERNSPLSPKIWDRYRFLQPALSKKLVLLAFLALTFGCSFAKARTLDFADIFKFKVHWGYGIGATAYCTQFIDFGLEIWSVPFPFPFPDREHRYNVLAFQHRSLRLLTNFASFHSGVFPGASFRKIVWSEKGIYYDETRLIALWDGIYILGEGHGERFSVKEWNKNYDRNLFGVGFCVHAGLAGVSFEVSIEELLDFLLGWFGIDILDDDAISEPLPGKKRLCPKISVKRYILQPISLNTHLDYNDRPK